LFTEYRNFVFDLFFNKTAAAEAIRRFVIFPKLKNLETLAREWMQRKTVQSLDCFSSKPLGEKRYSDS
jgi:hypothetical protein